MSDPGLEPPGQYQAYPGGPVQLPGRGPKPPLPQPVQRAFYLMLAGAVLAAIGALVGIGSKSALHTAIHNGQPNLSATQVDSLTNSIYVFSIVIGLIEAGLWVWMAYANRAGRRWARITATVFFGLATLGLIGGLSAHTSAAISVVFTAVTWLIGLGAIVLMWNRESSPYYNA